MDCPSWGKKNLLSRETADLWQGMGEAGTEKPPPLFIQILDARCQGGVTKVGGVSGGQVGVTAARQQRDGWGVLAACCVSWKELARPAAQATASDKQVRITRKIILTFLQL